jgi:hypothetical protein
MQTIHIVGLNHEQLQALSKEGFSYSTDGGLTLLHITVNRHIEENLRQIGRIIADSRVEDIESPDHTS